VAILGQSGSGKSTLAAALVAKGYRLVADDCVIIQRDGNAFFVTAAYPGLRLTDTSVRISGIRGFEVRGAVSRHSSKMRLTSKKVDGPVPAAARHQLLAVVVLQHCEDTTSSVELGAAAAGIELIRHSFHLNGPAERAEALRRVLPVAAACPVFRMYYDHTHTGLRLASQEIESVLSSAEIGGMRL
jgi:hypothetical protein